jgi:hypothetical protein
MIANSTVSTSAIIFILSGDHFLLEKSWEPRALCAESRLVPSDARHTNGDLNAGVAADSG